MKWWPKTRSQDKITIIKRSSKLITKQNDDKEINKHVKEKKTCVSLNSSKHDLSNMKRFHFKGTSGIILFLRKEWGLIRLTCDLVLI